MAALTALNVGFLVLIGQTWHHAIVAGIVQAQIGEFSFLLSVVGADAGVISDGDGRLVIAVTVHRPSAVQPRCRSRR